MNSKVVRESTPLGNQRPERHTSESAPGNRCSCDHNQRGYVRRSQSLTQDLGGEMEGGFGVNSFGASFSIWSCIW